jgi:hypothetical protein
MTSKREIQVHASAQAPLPATITPMDMIDRALTSGAAPDVLEKFMALHERWEDNRRRIAFNQAIADAKPEIPAIIKNQQKSGAGGSYKYEDIADVARVVDPILASHGLGYKYVTARNGEEHGIGCVLYHTDGHEADPVWLWGKPDNTGSKNSIQAVGSLATYFQRYTLKLALGISASKDDDGHGAGNGAVTSDLITDKQLADLEALITEVDADTHRFLKFLEGAWNMPVKTVAQIPARGFSFAVQALEARRGRAK